MSLFSGLKNRFSGGRVSHLDNVPRLPDHVDDNFYLATASRAGEIDRASGAYDEFLFSDDKLGVMPFESSVDHHLSLVEMRLKDQGRRALLEKQEDLFELDGKISSTEHAIAVLENRITAQSERLDEQRLILAGERRGRANLYWPGSVPEVPSIWNAILQLITPIVIFIVVGLIDWGIIVASLTNVPGFKESEARMFSFPAIGVQLIFPHLIGDRLNLIMRGIPKRGISIAIAGILLAIWVSFSWVMTVVRMDYISSLAEQEGEAMNDYMYYGLYAGNLIMLIGLGTWLLVLAAKANHHQHEFVLITFFRSWLQIRMAKNNSNLVKLQSKKPVIEEALTVISQSYQDAVTASAAELAEAAKAVYRRSLVNQFGAVEFTSAYLTDSKTSGTAKPEVKRPRNSQEISNAKDLAESL